MRARLLCGMGWDASIWYRVLWFGIAWHSSVYLVEACCPNNVKRYMLEHSLYATCDMLCLRAHGECYMLSTKCYMLRATCYMLHDASCCVLPAICYVHVACQRNNAAHPLAACCMPHGNSTSFMLNGSSCCDCSSRCITHTTCFLLHAPRYM